ncbi:RNA-metabolising metallo-beta-lactamase [Solidesulfovibrio fructosivorans JJ]]|uniref:Ribonuclease J n=1 Tax=Solidesulfovibrio fructosivorans JJ] TaxID=596151 RepID=E1JXI6_SOLFR|nr:ribonuclease J [Solidesulfovibrio fructosivorans]EFL50963.1 RNA-metabolising metallo-beta-lactamase [Solidesulfovibrio fructosivorans JJ]]
MNSTPAVTLYPLGGLGEIGLNCMALVSGESMIVVDCGLMFPDDSLFGIDVVIPRFDFILANKDKLKGIILTHGHEDHIGALPWLMRSCDATLYGSSFTLALAAKKLEEHNLKEFTHFEAVEGGQTITLGDFKVTFFPVCHSIVRGFGLGIETPAGRIVHTGDFKIDRTPLDGHATDLPAIKAFSEKGVMLLLSDSTNAEREGFALAEREIKSALAGIFKEAAGRIVVTLFSSHIQRMQEIYDLAHASGRKVAVSGKSLFSNIEIARELGHLRVPAGAEASLDDLPSLPDNQVVLLVTGSQGEPLSALSRLAYGEHRQIKVQKGDTVILSSRFIPGNVRAITRLINRLYKLGAEVLYESVQAIHASGHAHAEELRLMLRTVSPKFFIPVHGEYRHLVKHARIGVSCGVAPERALVIEDGQPVTFSDGLIRLEDPIPVEHIYVDGKGVGDVGVTVLKERQLLAGEGLVIVVMVVDEKTGELTFGPNILSKGFVFEQHYSHVLEDAKCIVLDIYENVPPGQSDLLKERIRSALRRFFRKVLERDPVVVPLVITL